MIETYLLRYVIAAADTGSFSRAADQFGIKQSTLSRHILYLEDRLGLALFQRSPRGVAPTGVGEGFLRRARRIVADMEALGTDCSALAREASMLFRFGFQGSLHCGDLSELFRSFREAFPDVEVAPYEQERARLLRALERDELDLAIIGGFCDRQDLVSAPLWHEPVMLCVAGSHSLAEQERLYWTDLRAKRFVVTADDPGPDLRDLAVSRLSGPGHAPIVTLQKVSRDNLPALVSEQSMALLAGPAPAGTTRRYAFRPIHDAFGPTSIEYRAYWRRDNGRAPLGHFLDLLADRMGVMPPR